MRRHFEPSGLLVLVACLLSSLGPPSSGGETSTAKIAAVVRNDFVQAGKVCATVLVEDATVDSVNVEQRREQISEVQEKTLRALPEEGYEIRYRYRYSTALVIEVKKQEVLTALQESSLVRRVIPNVRGSGALIQSGRTLGADRVHERGVTGAGRFAAILDTGVDFDHPDLVGSVVHQQRFLSEGEDVGPTADDDNGHGTHVAGIIVARSELASGIAPDVNLISIKVLDRFRRGFFCDWAAGVEHVIDLHLADNGITVDVINMSLASDDLFEGFCDDVFPPLRAACEQANRLGISLTTCSGNSSHLSRTGSPSCYTSTISVASVIDVRPTVISRFSNRNHTVDYLAPGEVITSTWLDGSSRDLSGCSQAAPHVAATICLMKQVDPSLTPAALRQLLTATAIPAFDAATELTFPSLHTDSAVRAAATGDCNGNGVRDYIDIVVTRTSSDCNKNDVPDECEPHGNRADDDQCDGDLPFHRGDTNDDGTLDASDALFLLRFLFTTSGGVTCLNAADVDNDGELNITDGVYVLGTLFLGWPPPPPPGAPGNACGLDPESPGDSGFLGCEAYRQCQ